MERFGELLKKRLEKHSLSIRAFAKSVNSSHQFVARVLAGQRLPPLDHLDRWLEHAGVTEPAEVFAARLAAHLEHCPPFVSAYVAALHEGLDQPKAQRAAEQSVPYQVARRH